LFTSPTALSFTYAVGGVAPAPQALSVSDAAGQNYAWLASITYDTGSGWLLLNGNQTAAGVTTPAQGIAVSVATSLPPGRYDATITLTGNGQTTLVPVSYVVQGITFSPSAIVVSVPANSPPTEYSFYAMANAFIAPDGVSLAGQAVTFIAAGGLCAGFADPATCPRVGMGGSPVVLNTDSLGHVALTVFATVTGGASGEFTMLEAFGGSAYNRLNLSVDCMDGGGVLCP
jgi:hypothetical protein